MMKKIVKILDKTDKKLAKSVAKLLDGRVAKAELSKQEQVKLIIKAMLDWTGTQNLDMLEDKLSEEFWEHKNEGATKAEYLETLFEDFQEAAGEGLQEEEFENLSEIDANVFESFVKKLLQGKFRGKRIKE